MDETLQNLASFSAGDKNTLAAVKPDEAPSSNLSEDSVAHMSTTASLIKGGEGVELEENRDIIAYDLRTTGESVDIANIEADGDKDNEALTNTAVENIVMSPEVSDEVKRQSIAQLIDRETHRITLSERYAKASLSRDDKGATALQEEQREKQYKYLKPAADYVQYKKKLHTDSMSELAATTSNGEVFLDSMVTAIAGTDQAAQMNLVNALKEHGIDGSYWKTVALLGESRVEIQENIKDMPLDARRKLFESIVPIIKESANLIGDDPNAVTAVQNLETFLGGRGDISTFDRVVDDVISILDLIGGKFTISRAIGKAKQIADLGKALKKGNLTKVEFIKKAAPQPEGKFFESLNKKEKAVKEGKGTVLAPVEESAPVPSFATKKERRRVRKAQERARKRNPGPEFKHMNDDQAWTYLKQLDSNNKAVKQTANPASPAAIAAKTNASEARMLTKAALDDVSGETARGTHNATREAIVSDMAADVQTLDGTIAKKAVDVDQINRVELVSKKGTSDEELAKWAESNGGINYHNDDVVKLKDNLLGQLHRAKGLRLRDDLSQLGVTRDGDSFQVTGIYEEATGPFATGTEALAHAEFGLRHLGVDKTELSLYKNVLGEYIPVTDDIADKGEYVVGVTHSHAFDPNDIAEGLKSLPERSFMVFSAIKGLGTQLTLNPALWIRSPSARLGALVTDAGQARALKSTKLHKVLTERINDLSDMEKRLPDEQKAAAEDMIRYNSANRVNPTLVEMKARSLSDDAVSYVFKRKEYQDLLYMLNDSDLKTSLKLKGWKVMDVKKTGFYNFLRPVSQEKANITRKHAYDPVKDEVVFMDKTLTDELYAKGGTVAELRTPMKIDDVDVSFAVSNERAESSFIREITTSDKALNKLPGYEQVVHKANRWILQKVATGGKSYMRAWEKAGSQQQAELILRKLQNDNPGVDFIIGGDKDAGKNALDFEMDVATTRGLSAQKTRHGLAGEGNSPLDAHDNTFVYNGWDAMALSARTISDRVAFRSFLETEKHRFIKMYKDILPEKAGQPVYPSKIGEIGEDQRIFGGRQVAAAREMYQYIHSLEVGSLTNLDSWFKALMNVGAEVAGRGSVTRKSAFGKKASAKAEQYLYWAGTKQPVNAVLRRASIMMVLSTIARQFVLPLGQVALISAKHPAYVVSGKLAMDAMGVLQHKVVKGSKGEIEAISGSSISRMDQIVKEMDIVGINNGLDFNNLVNKSLADRLTVDQLKGNRAARDTKLFGKGFEQGLRKGEGMHRVMSWLAEREAYLQKTGKKSLDKEGLERVTANTENATLGLNKADRLAYDSSSIKAGMSFFGVLHKGLLQYTVHKGFTRSMKARMFTASIFAFGVPMPVDKIETMFGDVLPENEDDRRLVVRGLYDYGINAFWKGITGDDSTDIDFTGSSVMDVHGVNEMFFHFITGDINGLLTNSPVASLTDRLFKSFQVAGTAYRAPSDDDFSLDDMGLVAHSFLKVFAGYNNADKALIAAEFGKMYDNKGAVTAEGMNWAEVFHVVAGFNPAEVAQKYAAESIQRDVAKDVRDRAKSLVDTMVHLNNLGDVYLDNKVWYDRMVSMAWRLNQGENSAVIKAVGEEIRKRHKRNITKDSMTRLLDTGLKDSNKARQAVSLLKLHPKQKAVLMQAFNDMDEGEENLKQLYRGKK